MRSKLCVIFFLISYIPNYEHKTTQPAFSYPRLSTFLQFKCLILIDFLYSSYVNLFIPTATTGIPFYLQQSLSYSRYCAIHCPPHTLITQSPNPNRTVRSFHTTSLKFLVPLTLHSPFLLQFRSRCFSRIPFLRLLQYSLPSLPIGRSLPHTTARDGISET